jgi:hypothetical protein
VIKNYRVLFRLKPEVIIDFYDNDLCVIQQFLSDLAFKFLGRGEVWIQSKYNVNEELKYYYHNQITKAHKQFGIIKPIY